MANNGLDKHRRLTKKIQKETGKSYRAAQKEASRELQAKKVSGHSKPKKKAGRVGGKQKYVVHHTVERVGKLTYKGGEFKIGALTIPQAREQVRQKLAWELLAKDSAKNVKDKKTAAKKVKALKALNTKLNKI